GWVPLLIGVGFLIGHYLFLLRTGARWGVTRWLNVPNLAISGAAGALAAHAVRLSDRSQITPGLIGALILGGVAYAIVSAALLAVTQRLLGYNATPVVQGTLRT